MRGHLQARPRRTRRVRLLGAVLAAALVLAACVEPEDDPDPAAAPDDEEEVEPDGDDPDPDEPAAVGPYEHLERALAGEFEGETVEILNQWVAEDGEQFVETLRPFQEQTGITLQIDGIADYTTTLVARSQGGNPPDIAQIAQPGLMRQLAADGHLVPVGDWIDTDQLTSDFGEAWIEMTSHDGTIHGITWGAFTKSIVWYPQPAFDEAGYEIPETWEELEALSEQIIADGNGNPWCISVEQGDFSGWPLTDWVEDVLLRTAPPEVYDGWMAGEIPFTDPQVAAAFELTADFVFRDDYAYGGPTWMNETWVGDTPLPMFHGQDPPDCWLHKQAAWIADFFLADPVADADDPEAERLTPGEDAEFFVLPPIEDEFGTPVLGAADQFVMFDDRPEVRALMEYLVTPDAVEPMIAAGGFISPNESVPEDWYQDYSSQRSAEILAEATTIRDDASDNMPPAVQSAFNSAMVDWIRAEGQNTTEILERLDAVEWEREE